MGILEKIWNMMKKDKSDVLMINKNIYKYIITSDGVIRVKPEDIIKVKIKGK